MKKSLLLLVSLSLLGCAQLKQFVSNDQAETNKLASTCASNSYLKSYGCSVRVVKLRAERGDADAQYALGYMYYYGAGIKANAQLAELWIRRSAAQGQVLAKKALLLISRQDRDSLVSAQSSSSAPVSGGATYRKKSQSNHSLTVQLMTSSNLHLLRAQAERLTTTHQPVHIYRVLSKSNRDNYILTYGEFGNSKQARLYVNQLPAHWKKNRPWVRPLSAFSYKKIIL